jgi:DNA-binding NtrC family response regulator
VRQLLIVDDDLDVCWILQQHLELHGYAVAVAHNGVEGLARSKERRPAIVLDVEMPVLDGPGMSYRLLLEDAGLEKVPIVLMSGYHDLRAIARRVGTPYAIGKPFDVAGLLGLIERAIAERTPPRPDR